MTDRKEIGRNDPPRMADADEARAMNNPDVTLLTKEDAIANPLSVRAAVAALCGAFGQVQLITASEVEGEGGKITLENSSVFVVAKNITIRLSLAMAWEFAITGPDNNLGAAALEDAVNTMVERGGLVHPKETLTATDTVH